MEGFTSKLIHGNRNTINPYGAIRGPIYQSAAFEFENSQKISDSFMGKYITPAYSRTANPTLTELEQKMTLISGALSTLVVSSGMAAISNVMLTIAGSGENIITTPYLFGNTYSLFNDTLKYWGLETRFADFHQPETIEALIDSKTRAIFLETVTNPQMAVFDIEKLSEIANRHQILLILDNTLMTPYLFESKKFGVHLEILSTTKFVSGGGTGIGGAVLDYGNYNWEKIPKFKELIKIHGPMAFMKKLRGEVYRNVGACLSPENAFLQSLGMETLCLRIDRSCENAMKTAQYLKTLPYVKKVNYPGLKEDAYYPMAKKLFNQQFGGLLTFEMESQDACFKLMDNLKMIRRATNMNDNKSLIIHPFSTIYSEYSDELKLKLGVNDRLIRLSVGIEDFIDIQKDISDAGSFLLK